MLTLVATVVLHEVTLYNRGVHCYSHLHICCIQYPIVDRLLRPLHLPQLQQWQNVAKLLIFSMQKP